MMVPPRPCAQGSWPNRNCHHFWNFGSSLSFGFAPRFLSCPQSPGWTSLVCILGVGLSFSSLSVVCLGRLGPWTPRGSHRALLWSFGSVCPLLVFGMPFVASSYRHFADLQFHCQSKTSSSVSMVAPLDFAVCLLTCWRGHEAWPYLHSGCG